MTRLTINHETVYRYSKPTRFGQHRLVLRPREGHDLQIESMVLSITPGFSIEWSRDVFGNSVALVEFLESATELRILSSVVIRRAVRTPPASAGPYMVAYPVLYDELEQTVASAYQVPTYPDELAQVSGWVKKVLAGSESTDAVGKVSLLNQAIFRDMRYQRRETKGVQRPVETLAEKSGSCRDMATLLMEACRSLGIAARFSSGYLDCAAARAGMASTHAWAEVYFPGWGWTGFDPTLGELTSFKHIAVGVSNHPRGVMPVSGRFYGNSFDYLGMKVSVKMDSEDPQPATSPLASSPSSP